MSERISKLISYVVRTNGHITAEYHTRHLNLDGSFKTRNIGGGLPDNLRMIARQEAREKHVAYGEINMLKVEELVKQIASRQFSKN